MNMKGAGHPASHFLYFAGKGSWGTRVQLHGTWMICCDSRDILYLDLLWFSRCALFSGMHIKSLSSSVYPHCLLWVKKIHLRSLNVRANARVPVFGGKNAVNRYNHFQLLRTEEDSTLPFWFREDKKTCLYQIASHCPVWKHELWISSFMWGLLTQPKEVRTLELSLEANSLKTHHSVWTYFPESA